MTAALAMAHCAECNCWLLPEEECLHMPRMAAHPTAAHPNPCQQQHIAMAEPRETPVILGMIR